MLSKMFLQAQEQRLRSKKCRVVAALRKLEKQPLDDHGLYKLTTELPLINKALRRIKGGAYGTCVDCHEDIPIARLKAHPEAVRCLDCQASVERASHDHR